MEPKGIHTREDFAQALTTLRNESGLTVRELARRLDTPVATIGDYVSGRHLPGLSHVPLFTALLRECGVDERSLRGWVDALTRLRQSSDGRTARGPAPYRGLEPFGVDDAPLFFGRDAATDDLLERLRYALRAGSSEVVWPLIVVGPSGSGKSSLLRAGLAARVASGALNNDVPYEVTVVTPGTHPADGLARLAAPSSGVRRLLIIDQFEEVFGTSPEERERFFATLMALRPPDVALVVALRADFYAAAAGEAQLLPALRRSQVLIGPMSADEIRAAIVEPARTAGGDVDPALVELLLADLNPGGPDESAHASGALPLLSHALLVTWERARRSELTVADYRAAGGLRGAVSQSAEDLYSRLAPEEQELTRRMFCRLVRIDDEGPSTRRRVSPRELAGLVAADGDEVLPTRPRVLDRFVSARLLTAGADTVEVSHEALLTAWPRLAEWLAADRAGLRLHRQLTESANAWADSGEDEAQLLRGTRLNTAAEWASDHGHRGELNTTERRFLDASVAQAEAEQAAARRRIRRAQEAALLIGVLAIAAVVLAVVAFGARRSADHARIVALSRQVAAEATLVANADPALAMQLAVTAFRISPTTQATSSLLDSGADDMSTRILGPNGAMTLALDGEGRVFAVVSSPANRVQLYRAAIPRPHLLAAFRIGSGLNQLYTAALSPDGRLLAISDGTNTVALWSVSTPVSATRIATLRLSSAVDALTFSPNGDRLAAVTDDGNATQWSLSETSRPAELPSLTVSQHPSLSAVAYSPNGHALATVGTGGTLAVWNLTAPRPRLVARRTVATTTMTTVAYSPNGATLVAGANDLTVWHWRVSPDGAPVGAGHPLRGFGNQVASIAYSDDGKYLAVGDADDTTRIWQTSDWKQITTLPDVSTVDGVGFLAHDHQLATVDDNGTTRLWDLPPASSHLTVGAAYTIDYTSGGHEIAVITDGRAQTWNTSDPWHPFQISTITMPPSFGPVASVGAMTLDGKLLAVGNTSGDVQEFELDVAGHGHAIGPVLPGGENGIEQINFTPNGRLLSVGYGNGAMRLYDITDPEHPRPLSMINLGQGNSVFGVSYSPNGRLMAIGCNDRQVWLWDISNPRYPRRLAVLGGFSNAVYTTTISPDAKTLVGGSEDDTIRMWDITNPSHPRLLGPPLAGPTETVYQVAISPDGGTLAASTTGGEVWLWNIADPAHPQALATLHAATGALYDLTFSPDDQTFVVGSDTQAMTFWHYHPEAVIRRICAFAGTPITRQEWARYLPGAEYHPPCP